MDKNVTSATDMCLELICIHMYVINKEVSDGILFKEDENLNLTEL